MPPRRTIELSAIKRIENEAFKIGGVVSLAQGIPSIGSHEIIRSSAIEAITKGQVDRYSLSAGISELREALIKKYNLDETESDVIITTGAIEALSATFLALCNTDDEVISFSPYYAAYIQVVKISGATIVDEPLLEENNWRPDLNSLRKKITPKTKAIILCSPHNPTGMVLTKEELEGIGQIALENDLFIVSDDVYKDFYYTNERPYLLQDNPIFRDRLIHVSSFSKNFSLTGWRVGFLIGPKKLLTPVFPVHDALVNCAPVVSQYAALSALKSEEKILAEVMPTYLERRKLMGEVLETLRDYLDFAWPEGSYFFFVKIKNLKDSEKFCFDMLREDKVAVVPGSAFGPSGEGYIRLCFGRSEEDIKEAMTRIKKYLIKWVAANQPT